MYHHPKRICQLIFSSVRRKNKRIYDNLFPRTPRHAFWHNWYSFTCRVMLFSLLNLAQFMNNLSMKKSFWQILREFSPFLRWLPSFLCILLVYQRLNNVYYLAVLTISMRSWKVSHILLIWSAFDMLYHSKQIARIGFIWILC